MTTDKQRYACTVVSSLATTLKEKYMDKAGYIHISQEDLDNIVDKMRKEIRK